MTKEVKHTSAIIAVVGLQQSRLRGFLGGQKMKVLKTTTILCVAFTLGVLPSLASATTVGTVDIAHSGHGASGIINIWGGGHSGLSGHGGVYMLDKTAGTGQGDLWPDGPVGGFCIELHQWASDNTLTYGVVMPEQVHSSYLGSSIGPEKAEYLRELWGRFFDSDWVGSGPFTSQQDSGAEAFAAAVWEIIYEDLPQSPLWWDVTADGTAGDLGFRCENADTATANSWLHALDGAGPKADLRAFVHCNKQDYLVEVPEPATIALLGLGALASLCTRR